MATIAIGDIHGNIRALDDLLRVLAEEIDGNDTVVFLGDYIDRGPDSKACIARILDFRQTTTGRVVTLLGNHEQWLIRTYRDYTCHSWILGMEALSTIQSYSGVAASALRQALGDFGARIVLERLPLPYDLFFDAVPTAHIEFLSSLRTFFRSEDAVCVHGGLDPAGERVEQQMQENLVWGMDGFPECYRAADVVLYGHANNPVVDRNGWPHPRIVGRTFGLDTIGKGVLTAIRLPDGAVFQSRRFS
jgi:serine/threonine protein phosphatase 1